MIRRAPRWILITAALALPTAVIAQGKPWREPALTPSRQQLVEYA
jgi:hypothetical protein